MDDAQAPTSFVYFHGLPGSARELSLVEHPIRNVPEVLDPLDFEAFDARYDQHTPARVIGFSLGAFSALKLAAARPESVSELILISPAGPLESGLFLDQMAGAPVFKMAQRSSIAFAMMTAAQALAAHISPRFVLSRMFAHSCDAEKALLDDATKVMHLENGLKASLWSKASSYRRTIRAYVRPWEHELAKVRCKCRVFHGDLDNWVPIDMARVLSDRLPQGCDFQTLEGLGHYTTLMKALPSVLSETMAPR